MTEKASQQMAADEAKKRGELQDELIDEHKAHQDVANRLVKETSQKIDLAKRLVNAEATSLVRFDASKELENQLKEGDVLKKELAVKAKEVSFAKEALKEIATTPAPPQTRAVDIKVNDPNTGKSAEMAIVAPENEIPAMAVKVTESVKKAPESIPEGSRFVYPVKTDAPKSAPALSKQESSTDSKLIYPVTAEPTKEEAKPAEEPKKEEKAEEKKPQDEKVDEKVHEN